ncbi:hypothetical protein [Curtobacterium sp. MCSS17_016]|uniref:hypothetical protein n=1 Tax=Curtobacterium sp. MCSS17_016 TaxID=2175644 RepID=UPI0011B66420|nr:hypothetical protein [Curtobacterium sp. MCSS17_016]WIE81220.1 hypothetical protein DEJ19_018475 [Curtobacterium sp. MCSS17_016]
MNSAAENARETARMGDGKFGAQHRSQAPDDIISKPANVMHHASQFGGGVEGLRKATAYIDQNYGIGSAVRVSPADQWVVLVPDDGTLGDDIIGDGVVYAPTPGGRVEVQPQPKVIGTGADPFNDPDVQTLFARLDEEGYPYLMQRVPLRYDNAAPEGWAVFVRQLPDTENLDTDVAAAERELRDGTNPTRLGFALENLRDSAQDYLDELDRTGTFVAGTPEQPSCHDRLQDAVNARRAAADGVEDAAAALVNTVREFRNAGA